MRRGQVIAALAGLVLFLTMTAAVLLNLRESEQRDAAFLAQCHDAGYDAAKCRFFLTATRRMNGAAAAQMILEAATPK